MVTQDIKLRVESSVQDLRDTLTLLQQAITSGRLDLYELADAGSHDWVCGLMHRCDHLRRHIEATVPEINTSEEASRGLE